MFLLRFEKIKNKKKKYLLSVGFEPTLPEGTRT